MTCCAAISRRQLAWCIKRASSFNKKKNFEFHLHSRSKLGQILQTKWEEPGLQRSTQISDKNRLVYYTVADHGRKKVVFQVVP